MCVYTVCDGLPEDTQAAICYVQVTSLPPGGGGFVCLQNPTESPHRHRVSAAPAGDSHLGNFFGHSDKLEPSGVANYQREKDRRMDVAFNLKGRTLSLIS